MRTHDRPLSQRSDNLPAQHTTLIGRDDDTARVGELVLTSSGRLVTLTGTGGCGKTQLALHAAAALVGNFADGVWLVSLAPVRDASLIPSAIASAVGCRERAGEPLAATILAYLAERELLLLVDNCEHLIEACAALAEQILDACPSVRVLATSRERLRTTGEQTWRVSSLAVPDPEGAADPERLLQYSAVRLFAERAQAVQPSFALGKANARTVTSICARLEGLPLAIELAAARTGVLSLAEILERLDDAFRLLVGGSRTAPNRQQTMHATLEWSYSLLAADEQIVFQRLVVFAGGWSVAAAEAVCADQTLPQQDVLEVLGRLVDKSLVVASEQAGRSRFRLLEPIRQYAHEKLLTSDECAAAQARHARYFLDFAERLQTDANVGGSRRMAAQEELAQEQDNLRVALRWCIDNSEASMGLRLAEALTGLWIVRSMTNEGRSWLSQVLAVPGAEAPTLERAAVLIHLGFMANRQADYAQARTLLEEALPITRGGHNAWLLFCNLNDLGAALQYSSMFGAAQEYMEEALATTRAAGDRASEAHMLNNLGYLAFMQEDLVAARPSIEQGLALARTLGDTWTTTFSLVNLGKVFMERGEFAAARIALQECLSTTLQIGERWVASHALRELARLAIAQGQLLDAGSQICEALTIQQELNDRTGLALSLETAGQMASVNGQGLHALRLAGAAAAVRDRSGTRASPIEQTRLNRWLVPLLAALGEQADAAWSFGHALSQADAVALAQVGPTPPRAAPAVARRTALEEPVGPLTPRQAEVAALVGHGCTNKQIAEQLVITERAAAAHIEHIMDRLGFSSRTQIGVWASERGLLAAAPD